MEHEKKILAAGAVIWRKDVDDRVQVALIRRTQYQDWSFPKGKVERNESLIACAFREVLEETGFSVRFGAAVGEVTYQVDEKFKSVTYWSAEFLNQIAAPDPKEVDEVQWLYIEEAEKILSRDLDKAILHRFCDLDLDAKPLILLRHAKAIEQGQWGGDDLDRPLSAVGERQARQIIENFAPYFVEEIHSSSAVRCYESVTPMARSLNIDFFFTDSISDYVYQKNPDRSINYITRLLKNDYATLVCSHNPILPKTLSSLIEKFGINLEETTLSPADAWVIHHIDKEVLSIEFLPAFPD